MGRKLVAIVPILTGTASLCVAVDTENLLPIAPLKTGYLWLEISPLVQSAFVVV
jgi:hypothetical protein